MILDDYIQRSALPENFFTLASESEILRVALYRPIYRLTPEEQCRIVHYASVQTWETNIADLTNCFRMGTYQNMRNDLLWHNISGRALRTLVSRSQANQLYGGRLRREIVRLVRMIRVHQKNFGTRFLTE